ncbi:hypothetical protein GCM10010411_18020 [Actinomadura fulvescens]|uniref:Uncharacterized protein n=1 Tax=Actinomadura fulvescens TaxID=46160 RepID=A0ABP6BSZ0_9ACTN
MPPFRGGPPAAAPPVSAEHAAEASSSAAPIATAVVFQAGLPRKLVPEPILILIASAWPSNGRMVRRPGQALGPRPEHCMEGLKPG